MSRVNLFIAFLVLLGITACSILGSDDKKRPDVLRPMAVGNYWEYEATYLSLKDTLRFEVTREVSVPIGDTSLTAFAMNVVPFPPGAPEYYWLYRNGENGLYQMGGIADTDTLFANNLEYPYPAEVGQTLGSPQLSFSWSNLDFYVSDTLSITLVEKGRRVETPAGSFTCLVYKFSLRPAEDVAAIWDYFIYYSPGAGLITQRSISQKSGDVKEEMRLISYKVQ